MHSISGGVRIESVVMVEVIEVIEEVIVEVKVEVAGNSAQNALSLEFESRTLTHTNALPCTVRSDPRGNCS